MLRPPAIAHSTSSRGLSALRAVFFLRPSFLLISSGTLKSGEARADGGIRFWCGMKLPRGSPNRASCANHSEPPASVLRPGTFLMWREWTTRAGIPAASSA